MALAVALAFTSCATEETKVHVNDPSSKPKGTIVYISPDHDLGSEWEGEIDRDAVRKVIRTDLSKFKNCYEKEVKIQPNFQCKIVVEFEIKDDGTVKKSKVKTTTMRNKSFEKCVVNLIAKEQFPPAEPGKIVVVRYPFFFGTEIK